jgi:hypothetical protein
MLIDISRLKLKFEVLARIDVQVKEGTTVTLGLL